MLIYTPHITPRIVYVTHWVFSSVFQTPYRLTDNFSLFEQSTGARLNYSNKPVSNVPQILPCGLLTETGVQVQQIPLYRNAGKVYPFAVGNDLLGFDVLAAVFYFISRYEEYLPHKKDQYGRFMARESLHAQIGDIATPLVDEWLWLLKAELQMQEPAGKFSSLFTYDIDTAYAYRGRPLWLTATHILKDLFTFRFKAITKRLNVLRARTTDPYDTYNEIVEQAATHGLDTLFFFLLGNRNKYNRNLHHRSTVLRRLVNRVQQQTKTGIHPSYHTPANARLLHTELKRMRLITGTRVTRSRQHYLRFQLPLTFRQLAAAGIQEEYSMGYAETPGFRAGTCFPFYFFDVERNETTTLKIFPVSFMEGTFAEDMAATPEAAFPVMLQLLETVKKYNGFFCCIWHNHTLSDEGLWKGWKDIHRRIAAAVNGPL